MAGSMALFAIGVACGGDDESPAAAPTAETIIQTVIVEKEIAGETVIQTVVVVATPTTAPAVTKPTGPADKLNIALSDVGPPNYDPPQTNVPYSGYYPALGIWEPLLTLDESVSFVPHAAESWEISDNFGVITVKLRENMQFHKGWGAVTAEDVKFSYERIAIDGTVHPRGNIVKTSTDRYEVIDDRTIRFVLSNPSNDWFTNSSHPGGVPIISERYFDEMGAEFTNLNPVATGPFEVLEHRADEVISLGAVENHYRQTANVAIINILEVGEESTRIAMLKTGSVDIVQGSVGNLKAYTDIPGTNLIQGSVYGNTGHDIIFAGNYCVVDRPGYDPSLPWVGCPGTPEYENAKKVRLAMSIAIDRDGINEAFLSGVGKPMYAIATGTDHARWQDKWLLDYDPQRARELLEEAGYADGFEFTYYVPTWGDAREEIGEAILGMWAEIGLKATYEQHPYSTDRPTHVAREINKVWTHGWYEYERHISWIPLMTWKNGVETVWNPGMEHAESVDAWTAIEVAQPDLDKIETAFTDWVDWIWEEQLIAPVVAWKDPWVVGPRVASWDLIIHEGNSPPANLETLVLK